jgi:predicted nucleotidyltransferase component of viral defense system
MLFTETVEPHILRLLKSLMTTDTLRNFYLVGGTCLSLRYGHRKSVDLDLFSIQPFENESLTESLRSDGFDFKQTFSGNKLGIFGYIEGVKIDFVRHHYFPIIEKSIEIDGIRMFSDNDIIAMKISAILRRAVKKDFWDIAELLRYYPLSDFIRFYEQKYPSQQLLISIPRAISFFDDAEQSPDPDCLRGLTWEEVKIKISDAVREYLR